MNLQELVNNLSNKLASFPGDTPVHVKAGGNQDVANEVIIEDSEKGKTIVIR